MESGSNTTTTSPNKKVAETESGIPIKLQDWIFWYDDYRSEWTGGKVVEPNDPALRHYSEERYAIEGSGWMFDALEWAVAEGRIDPNHICNLDRGSRLKNHEVRYIKSSFQ